MYFEDDKGEVIDDNLCNRYTLQHIHVEASKPETNSISPMSMAMIESNKDRIKFQDLPLEIFLMILSYLNVKDFPIWIQICRSCAYSFDYLPIHHGTQDFLTFQRQSLVITFCRVDDMVQECINPDTYIYFIPSITKKRRDYKFVINHKYSCKLLQMYPIQHYEVPKKIESDIVIQEPFNNITDVGSFVILNNNNFGFQFRKFMDGIYKSRTHLKKFSKSFSTTRIMSKMMVYSSYCMLIAFALFGSFFLYTMIGLTYLYQSVIHNEVLTSILYYINITIIYIFVFIAIVIPANELYFGQLLARGQLIIIPKFIVDRYILPCLCKLAKFRYCALSYMLRRHFQHLYIISTLNSKRYGEIAMFVNVLFILSLLWNCYVITTNMFCYIFSGYVCFSMLIQIFYIMIEECWCTSVFVHPSIEDENVLLDFLDSNRGVTLNQFAILEPPLTKNNVYSYGTINETQEGNPRAFYNLWDEKWKTIPYSNKTKLSALVQIFIVIITDLSLGISFVSYPFLPFKTLFLIEFTMTLITWVILIPFTLDPTPGARVRTGVAFVIKMFFLFLYSTPYLITAFGIFLREDNVIVKAVSPAYFFLIGFFFLQLYVCAICLGGGIVGLIVFRPYM